jgi:hypothetical protein
VAFVLLVVPPGPPRLKAAMFSNGERCIGNAPPAWHRSNQPRPDPCCLLYERVRRADGERLRARPALGHPEPLLHLRAGVVLICQARARTGMALVALQRSLELGDVISPLPEVRACRSRSVHGSRTDRAHGIVVRLSLCWRLNTAHPTHEYEAASRILGAVTITVLCRVDCRPLNGCPEG